ncbi:hypothetical protein D1164_10445 [Mariniphaga sediminis]|jgi:hypothetical protein|uniref:Uncharacterized protein n=1 Tax=Mariniphaga sediminis TaxID=1628158 RepID=A0A399D2S9_9BACT|nr:hypothetical protein [Mariniphaga sediminis]RIH65001.1 hypothetical protein D1164_10445 [Mariniphaga sediminis]
MHLGKRCRYAKECTVYQSKNKKVEKPIFIIRNVFCNRGAKGWTNCKRFLAYEGGKPVDDDMTPYG